MAGRPAKAEDIRVLIEKCRTVREPGVVQWDVKGDTTFGPFEPSAATAASIDSWPRKAKSRNFRVARPVAAYSRRRVPSRPWVKSPQ